MSAGTLEEQIKEGFLEGCDFSEGTLDRVKVFRQAGSEQDWVPFRGGLELTPQLALLEMVRLWDQGYGLKVELKVNLAGDLDASDGIVSG